jgi:predicted amidohydrolase YtcJ
MSKARQLITGGRIFTADPERPWAQALLVENGRICSVGGDEITAACADENLARLDIAGGLVVPGFIDGHVHVAMTGSAMLKAQLQGAGSLEEIQRRVLEWAEANPDAPRVLGTNWVHGDIPAATPTRQMLDAIVPERCANSASPAIPPTRWAAASYAIRRAAKPAAIYSKTPA